VTEATALLPAGRTSAVVGIVCEAITNSLSQGETLSGESIQYDLIRLRLQSTADFPTIEVVHLRRIPANGAPMNRLIRWTTAVLLVCAVLAPTLGTTVRAQDDAQAQIDQTAAAMLALKSFRFDLETTAGTTSFQDAFELRSVTGDVVRPNSFQAKVEVKLAILTLTLEAVGIGGDIWVKNPIGGDDSFVQVTGGDSDLQLPPTILLNPDKLVTEALKYLDDPQLADSEELDGQQMTVITGTFDPTKLIGGGTPVAELENFNPASEPLDVKAWIDDQDRLVRIDFSGPLFSFEEGSGRLVRSITFSDFDADITIEQPA
jgi:hypothetical protein